MNKTILVRIRNKNQNQKYTGSVAREALVSFNFKEMFLEYNFCPQSPNDFIFSGSILIFTEMSSSGSKLDPVVGSVMG